MKNINLSDFFKPRNYLLFLATVIALAAGYYFLVALPAHNREKLALERERSAAEERQRQLQEQSAELQQRLRKGEQERLADEQMEREKQRLKRLADEYTERERERQAREERLAAEQAERKARLETKLKQDKLYFDCMEAAEKKYWDFVKLNGREDPEKPGVWIAPQWVWEEARRMKEADLTECDRLYRVLKE